MACVDQSDDGASSSMDEDFMESVAVKTKVLYQGSGKNHEGRHVPV